MNEPVDSSMKDFVQLQINKITTEYEKILSGWKTVDFTKENTTHLYNLFKRCSKQEIRMFEENNFLDEEEEVIVCKLITKKLQRSEPNNQSQKPDVLTGREIAAKSKSAKKGNKKKHPNKSATFARKSENNVEMLNGNCSASIETSEKFEPENAQKDKRVPNEPTEELTIAPCEVQEKPLNGQNYGELGAESKSPSQNSNENMPTSSEDKPKKRENPFDNEHSFIEPLLSTTPNIKDVENIDALTPTLENNYMSHESSALKYNLQKLATDISTEEQNIRARVETGQSASIDNAVLEDFISRANVVLKETEAVTVRKIAEAETKKFLTSLRVPTESALTTISNELMQDIWPKSNRWRSLSRVEKESPPLDEIDLKAKRRQDEQVERDVRAAIRSAGEPLNKKQIGQIRKAAIVYRDFDAEEQKEIDYRSDHTLKLVELVSAYEASNRMDELIRLRLAIAFCTKRRDYFLQARPPNFMQFSYMYIYLLEKINSKTASICACLNYQSTVSSDFNELEELLLNLFHEDYFLEDN